MSFRPPSLGQSLPFTHTHVCSGTGACLTGGASLCRARALSLGIHDERTNERTTLAMDEPTVRRRTDKCQSHHRTDDERQSGLQREREARPAVRTRLAQKKSLTLLAANACSMNEAPLPSDFCGFRRNLSPRRKSFWAIWPP